jgi:hypothetical protein
MAIINIGDCQSAKKLEDFKNTQNFELVLDMFKKLVKTSFKDCAWWSSFA